MAEIIVLRTHYYDDTTDRLVGALRHAGGRRIVAVVDERNGTVDIPSDIPKLLLDPEARGLFTPPDTAWRCGDYALYEAIRAFPAAAACWLIEPDIRIHASNIAAFFDGTGAYTAADLITAQCFEASPQWMWHATMAPFTASPHAVMLQLCRISRRAAVHLLRERRSLSEYFRAGGRDPQTWPNDEAFIGSHLKQPGFQIVSFKDHAPSFLSDGSFTFTKPVSERWLNAQPFNNRIYHPVCGGRKFRERLVAYLRDKGAENGIDGLPPADPLLRQLQIEEGADPRLSAMVAPLPSGGVKLPVPCLPIRFWNRIRNNGDALTALLAEPVFGAEPFYAKPTEPHLLGTGSILFMANRNSLVWGSGVLNKMAYLPPIDSRQIRALRGKLSADHLLQNGIRLGEIAFGDPGILADRLVGTGQPNRYRIGIVPHHDSMSHPFFESLRGQDDVCVVTMLDDTLAPLAQIAQCEIILSQSLHGLVYAESLGKPSLWIATRADDVWTFKFQDWFSTTANPQHRPALLDRTLDDLAGQAELRDSTIDRDALLQSFPRELLQPRQARLLPYASCRALAPVMLFFPKTHEAQPGFNAERDASALAALNGALTPILNNLFASWAEPTYVVAITAGSSVIPTPPQIRTILAAMDERSGAEFAFVVRQSPALDTVDPAPVPIGEGVTLHPAYKALGPTLILRPSMEKLTGNFILFGI